MAIAHQYLRVSTKRQSYAEQDKDNRVAAGVHRWPIGRTYEDVGSASKYSRSRRLDYERLIADLKNSVFKPGDVLILWESSRGSRRQSEWALLLDLLEDHGVLVHVTKDRRTYDPRNPRDRRTLDEDGTDSAYESAKTSQRNTRNAAANAAAGRPYGKPNYGYRRVYDEHTGKLSHQERHPDEAPVIEELFARLEKGHTLNAITADYAQRGVVNRSGNPFTREQLSKMARMPAYAKLRLQRSTGQMVEAKWPALVKPRRFWAVQRILEDPKRLHARPGRAKWLLSMIAMCQVCRGPLAVTYSRRGRHRGDTPLYKCQLHGHVLVDVVELDKIVEDVVCDFLSREDVYETFTAAEDATDERLAAIRADLAKARAEHDGLADSGISNALAAKREPAILARIAALESQEKELSTPSVLRHLVGGTRADVERRWDLAPMSTKREAMRLLLTPEWLGELRIMRRHSERDPSLEGRVIFWRDDRPVLSDAQVEPAEV